MSIRDAFIEVEARNKEQVLQQTWGHLAPVKNKAYRGYIIYTAGCFGNGPLNPTALACEFKGLDSSPWFFNTLQDFMSDKRPDAGVVYKFEGVFKNYKFTGKLSVLLDANEQGV